MEGYDGSEAQGYYHRFSTEDFTIVNIARPQNEFVTGGGYILSTGSKGIYAADNDGKKSNFGFNIKYNKSGKNLQGNVNVIYRRTEGTTLKVYQVKGNVLRSLSVNTGTDPDDPKTSVFSGKANLQDISILGYPQPVAGNLSFEIRITDKGEPGTEDQIAITVWNDAGGVMYSSEWDGVRTQEKVLTGGNIVVSGAGGRSGKTVARESAVEEKEVTGKLTVRALPNPTTTQFTLVVESVHTEAVDLRILDKLGRVVETRSNVAANSSITVGSHYRPGIYFVEVVQGSEKATLKLLKH